MPADGMMFLSLLFLLAAVASAAIGFRWVLTGRAVTDARFLAGIFTAFFMVALTCLLLSWRLACPLPDKWFNLDCLRTSSLFKAP